VDTGRSLGSKKPHVPTRRVPRPTNQPAARQHDPDRPAGRFAQSLLYTPGPRLASSATDSSDHVPVENELDAYEPNGLPDAIFENFIDADNGFT
jgi:hypothetical protein